MTDLRLNGKTPDGANLSLLDQDGREYVLRISDTLRATVNQPRLVSVSNDENTLLTVKEIQARLRAGDTVENLAREAQWSIDKVERFASPILQERSYIIGLAQDVVMKKESGRDPVNFIETVTARLAPRQVDMEDVEWNCWRTEDGTWIIKITYPNREGRGSAEWNFDLARRVLSALDDAAHWILGDENIVRERPVNEHGLVYGNNIPGRQSEPRSNFEANEPPRLVSIRDVPDAKDSEDGVLGRAKVPSWDEIMFGGSKNRAEEIDTEN